jgi:outer membrane lipoprotein SlyB
MKNKLLLGALLALAPCAILVPSAATARDRHSNSYNRHYKTFVGRDGRTYCRKADGTTGAIIGGVAGGVIGHEVAGRGDRTLGTLLGAGLGVVGGRAIERRRRTRCG